MFQINISDVVKFLSEVKSLERKKREGFRTEGVELPGSIAEHIFVTTHLSRIIAYYEGADIDKCIKMALFHDSPESRIGDSDKLARRYVGDQISEQTEALKDQVSRLDDELAGEMASLFSEKEEGETLEAIVVQDADWLECASQCKIYLDRGYSGFSSWINSIERALKTKTAKDLFRGIMTEDNFVSSYIERQDER